MIANATIASKTEISAPELLWTNPNPTAAFAAQNVTVSGDYDGYIVEVKNQAQDTVSGNQYRQIYVPNPLIIDNYHRFYLSIVTNIGSGPAGSQRQINSMENGTFAFAGGYHQASYSSWDLDNTYCIPTRIWGVKWSF